MQPKTKEKISAKADIQKEIEAIDFIQDWLLIDSRYLHNMNISHGIDEHQREVLPNTLARIKKRLFILLDKEKFNESKLF